MLNFLCNKFSWFHYPQKFFNNEIFPDYSIAISYFCYYIMYVFVIVLFATCIVFIVYCVVALCIYIFVRVCCAGHAENQSRLMQLCL